MGFFPFHSKEIGLPVSKNGIFGLPDNPDKEK